MDLIYLLWRGCISVDSGHVWTNNVDHASVWIDHPLLSFCDVYHCPGGHDNKTCRRPMDNIMGYRIDSAFRLDNNDTVFCTRPEERKEEIK